MAYLELNWGLKERNEIEGKKCQEFQQEHWIDEGIIYW